MRKAAEELFDRAIKDGWDNSRGGLYYTFDHETSQPIDTNKYYWAMAEMIAAAGLLCEDINHTHNHKYYQ